MQPGPHEGLAGGRLRLGDLVLVVREDEVDAAGVDVEGRTQVAHAHGRALDVPARPALADRGRPAGLARLGALPDREVAHVVLAVLVRLDALADALRIRVEARQAAVRGPAGDAEEDRAVVGAIGVARSSSVSMSATISGMCSVARGITSGLRDAQHVAGPPGTSAVWRAVSSPMVIALARRVADDLVVHVGDVHHPGDREALPGEVAAQQVGEEEAAEVADVRGRIDGRAAAVHADRARLERLEGLQRAAERVAERRRLIAPPRRRSRSREIIRPAPSSPARLPVAALTETSPSAAGPGAPRSPRASRPAARPPRRGRARRDGHVDRRRAPARRVQRLDHGPQQLAAVDAAGRRLVRGEDAAQVGQPGRAQKRVADRRGAPRRRPSGRTGAGASSISMPPSRRPSPGPNGWLSRARSLRAAPRGGRQQATRAQCEIVRHA